MLHLLKNAQFAIYIYIWYTINLTFDTNMKKFLLKRIRTLHSIWKSNCTRNIFQSICFNMPE